MSEVCCCISAAIAKAWCSCGPQLLAAGSDHVVSAIVFANMYGPLSIGCFQQFAGPTTQHTPCGQRGKMKCLSLTQSYLCHTPYTTSVRSSSQARIDDWCIKTVLLLQLAYNGLACSQLSPAQSVPNCTQCHRLQGTIMKQCASYRDTAVLHKIGTLTLHSEDRLGRRY